MLNTIKEAAENFCIHQLRESHEIKEGSTQKRTLIAYIDIDTQEDKKYRVYIASDQEFMQKVSKLFLEEDESDDETLQDMLLETANLIIGSAKVIAQETTETPFVISTPKFEKIGDFDFPVDESITVMLGNKELTVAIKELDV